MESCGIATAIQLQQRLRMHSHCTWETVTGQTVATNSQETSTSSKYTAQPSPPTRSWWNTTKVNQPSWGQNQPQATAPRQTGAVPVNIASPATPAPATRRSANGTLMKIPAHLQSMTPP